MPIGILRHGHAKYETLKVENIPSKFVDTKLFLEFANTMHDLKEGSINELQQSIEHRINKHPELKDKKIKVRFSPYARTIETAKYLVEGLGKHNLEITSLSCIESLKEPEGFTREMFNAMVTGGSMNINGQSVQLDITKTNPNGLNHTDYFFEGYYKKVDPNYIDSIGLTDRVASIETYTDVTARSRQVITRVFNAINDDTVVCMVSHQAFSDRITHEHIGVYDGQKPGEMFYITYKSGGNESFERVT